MGVLIHTSQVSHIAQKEEGKGREERGEEGGGGRGEKEDRERMERDVLTRSRGPWISAWKPLRLYREV
jgi:hypothetical protein